MTKNFDTQKNEVWLPYKFATGPVFSRFYEGLKEEKLLANICPKCEKVLVPPRTFCPECNVDMDRWVEASQVGEVVSWTVANYGFFGMPVPPPFIGALIRLDGTDCDFLHLIGGIDLTDIDSAKGVIKRGTRVRAVWSDKKRGHMLDVKYFEPI